MGKTKRHIRVLMAILGLDGHDRGAKTVVAGLREEGMEVIYAGLRQTPESIVEAAIKEDVDVIGLSSHSGGHNYSFSRVAELLIGKGVAKNILLIGGGIIPDEDIPFLKEKGVKAIFGPGTRIKDIAEFIRANRQWGGN